jgi:hypothetical protein
METPLRPWELVYEILHREGWSLGWCQQKSGEDPATWVVDGARGSDHIATEGATLGEGFGKLYCLTRGARASN